MVTFFLLWTVLLSFLVSVALYYRIQNRVAQFVGIIARCTSLWILVIALNGWPPITSIVPSIMILVLLDLLVFQKSSILYNVWLIVDVMTLVVTGILSKPPLAITLEALLTIGVFLVMVRITTDIIVRSKWIHLLGLLALVLGVAAPLVVLKSGDALRAFQRVKYNIYLIPQQPNKLQQDGIDLSTEMDQSGEIFETILEWQILNETVIGNPFDLIATVEFTHDDTGTIITSQMFYIGSDVWAFRFVGTQAGTWSFASYSDDEDLSNLTGIITMSESDDSPGKGFVVANGDQWMWSHIEEVFVPQIVMVGGPHYYYDQDANQVKADLIEEDLTLLLDDHGFTGIHIPVFCNWFDLSELSCGDINISDPNPDIRTFDTLETLITETYARGKMVHIWLWGDDSRIQNPKRWGINGVADTRLQRYIAARLGPLPGWTLGYGFDLYEWIDTATLDIWYQNMQGFFGWDHIMGARASKNQLDQLSESLDYSSYEQHRPDYDTYVKTIEARPDKPSFSEDRFRVREGAGFDSKDYDFDRVRRGLWESAMAGGVANIWGNLLGNNGANSGDNASKAFDNIDEIQTYFQFFENRFLLDMERCNELTDDTLCLYSEGSDMWIFYGQDITTMTVNLETLSDDISAIKVNTRAPYNEEVLPIKKTDTRVELGDESDWAMVITVN